MAHEYKVQTIGLPNWAMNKYQWCGVPKKVHNSRKLASISTHVGYDKDEFDNRHKRVITTIDTINNQVSHISNAVEVESADIGQDDERKFEATTDEINNDVVASS